MLGRVFERPPGRDKRIQTCFRRAEHGAQGVDVKQASILPFGRVDTPNMKRRHRRMPSLGMKRKRLGIEHIDASHIPSAGTPDDLSLGPDHHRTQRPHGFNSVHVQRHHLRVHVGKHRTNRRSVHAFCRRANPFHPMHEALHQCALVLKGLLDLPPALRSRSERDACRAP